MILNLLLLTSLAIITISSVKTPNGSDVTVIQASEANSSAISKANKEMNSLYPNALRLSSASTLYNCHSYTWYSQDVSSNKYWIKDPTLYYTDGSYVEVSPSNLAVRDRICCYSASNDNLHSGIVYSLSNVTDDSGCLYSNYVNVQSKWGGYGLYQHKGNYNPYVPDYNGKAIYVKFYRYNKEHKHSFNYTSFDNSYHYEECECGTLILKHSFSLIRVNPLTISPKYIQCMSV